MSEENNEQQEPKKIKLIHEKMFEELDINPEEVYRKSNHLKAIPKEWINEIIEKNIELISIPRIYQKLNLKEGSINMTFERPSDCEKFNNEFNSQLLKVVNVYILSKNKEPKDYNRIIVLESFIDNNQLRFSF